MSVEILDGLPIPAQRGPDLRKVLGPKGKNLGNVAEAEGEDATEVLFAVRDTLNAPLWKVLHEVGELEEERAKAMAARVAARMNVDCLASVTCETPLLELLA